jgi:hypothetical protein
MWNCEIKLLLTFYDCLRIIKNLHINKYLKILFILALESNKI